MHRTYHVALCDDEPIHLRHLEQESRGILEAAGGDFSLSAYLSGRELIDAVKAAPDDFDILLVDILLGDQNGIDTARELRQCGCDATIVFVTSTPDFAIKGYEVGAYRYLLKPIQRGELEAALLCDYRKARSDRWVVFTRGSQVSRIDVRDIRYIETNGRGTAAQLVSGTLELPSSISQAEALLPSHAFARCHKSYIVNIAHITRIDRASIAVSGGFSIPVGRKYYDTVRRMLMDYLAR